MCTWSEMFLWQCLLSMLLRHLVCVCINAQHWACEHSHHHAGLSALSCRTVIHNGATPVVHCGRRSSLTALLQAAQRLRQCTVADRMQCMWHYCSCAAVSASHTPASCYSNTTKSWTGCNTFKPACSKVRARYACQHALSILHPDWPLPAPEPAERWLAGVTEHICTASTDD